MVDFSRRMSALVVILALAAGNAAVCAGWMTTPEARMACCTRTGCSMHASDAHASSAHQGVTQAEADSCCAASERDDAAPSAPFVLALSVAAGSGAVSFLLPEPAVASAAWRTLVPTPRTHVSKHLLLRVLIV
jgi:predicted carbohydrate-binding protein with CBM5 and CBM33 domain